MPRYFFEVHDGKNLADEEGTVLPDVGAARKHAVTYAASLLMDLDDTFWSGVDWSMDVTDERGLCLFTLHFLAIASPSTATH